MKSIQKIYLTIFLTMAIITISDVVARSGLQLSASPAAPGLPSPLALSKMNNTNLWQQLKDIKAELKRRNPLKQWFKKIGDFFKHLAQT